jgi:TetR/AcrR family transcriptional regulator
VAEPSDLVLSTRERILAAAEKLFARRGFSGTSIRDITDAVGIKPPALYNHFPNKEDLYAEVLAASLRPLIELIDAAAVAADGAPDIESADQIMKRGMDLLREHPHGPALLMLEGITGADHLARIARDWIRPLIERGVSVLKENDASGRWGEDVYPNVIWMWFCSAFGHVALSALYAEVFDEDGLADAPFARHRDFMAAVATASFEPKR